MGILRKCALFMIGGVGYVLLELLWRGRSHISMFAAGGACFLLLGYLGKAEPRLPLPLRAVVGAGIITAVELLTGLLVNRDYGVWDYRALPANFHGQICLTFSLLWIPLSAAAMVLYGVLDKRLPGRR